MSISRLWAWLAAAAFMGVSVCAAAIVQPDRQSLEAQVKRYWATELQHDFDALYDMLGGLERNGTTREAYVKLRTETGPYRFVAATVGEMVLSGEIAWVGLKFEYTLVRFPAFPARAGETWQVWRYDEGWYPLGHEEAQEWPRLPPQLRPAAEEDRLRQRVAASWELKRQRDFARLYEFTLPTYRAHVPVEDFITRGKSPVLYLASDVQWVEIEPSGTRARARTDYSFKFDEPAMKKMQPVRKLTIEQWIKVDGEWYLDPDGPDDAKGRAS